MFKIRLIAFLVLIASCIIVAQPTDSVGSKKEDPKEDCVPQSLGSLFHKKDKPPKPERNITILVLPNLSSNPANGFVYGIGGSIGWWFGPRETTRVSFSGFTVAYTTKNQLLTFLKHNSYTKEDKMFLQGDWRYYIYSQATYGLGTNSPDTTFNPDPDFHWMAAPTSATDGAYPLKYDFLKFHEIVSFKIKENIYAGIGYHLDHYYNIKDEILDLDADTPKITPHYAYNVDNGFDPEKYTTSGFSLNFMYDSRDNLVNPYKGIYANINFKQNLTFLGSEKSSSFLLIDLRAFKSLSEKRPRHVIGAWIYGNFMVAGKAPYLTLQAIGDDQRAKTGRGYVQGRYRGENFLYGEAEWRFPISPCSQILGGVVFVNAVTVSNHYRDYGLFKYIRPGFGAGLRIMINAQSRTNINLDYGMGNRSKGFYFSGGETF